MLNQTEDLKLVKSEVTIRGVKRKLQVGQLFPNFKELAEYFCIRFPNSATSTTKAVEKDFRQWFDWQKVGRRELQITILHSTQQIRVGKSTSYSKYAMPIIAELLFYQKEVGNIDEVLSIVATNKELAILLGTCNSKLFDRKFIDYDWKEEIPKEDQLISAEMLLTNIVVSNHKKNNQILNDLRKSLRDASALIWNETFRYKMDGKTYLADKEVELKLLAAQSFALSKLGCFSKSEVHLKNLYIQFKNISFEYSLEHFNISRFQEVNHIQSTVGLITSYLRRTIIQENPKRKLSEKVLKSLVLAEINKFYKIKEIYANTKESESVEEIHVDLPMYSHKEARQELELKAKMHTMFRY
jgi:hypothetical protein